MNINKIASFINNSKRTQSVLRNISDNPSLYSTIGAFLISTTARPVATVAISKDKQDGIYSACSSVASAFVELIAGFLIFKPLQKYINKSSQQLYNSEKTIFSENAKLLRQYKSLTNRLLKLPTIGVTSMLRFSLVYPISLLLGAIGIVKNTDRAKKIDIKA